MAAGTLQDSCLGTARSEMTAYKWLPAVPPRPQQPW